MRWTWMAVLALVTGCDGIDLEQLVKQHPARTRVVPEAAGENCAHGGQALLAGLDTNDNGLLDDSEVTSTEYACATALSRQQPEPAGANCEHGGQAVRTGVDLDVNGQLEDSEVTATEYVCATATPNVLVRTRQVPPGEQCPNGGQVSHAGHDANGDGILDDTEITREVYGCTEADPVVVRILELPRFPNGCMFYGAIVEAGSDVDRDGVLDDAEVRADTRHCLRTTEVRTLQRPEPAGRHCSAGGTAVAVGADSNGDGSLGDNEVHDTLYVCQGARTYEGNYTVEDAADLAALQGISRVRGALSLRPLTLTQVALPGLMVVEGNLAVENGLELTAVDLGGVRFVGGNLVITSNPKLSTLQVGGTDSRRLLVWGDLQVDTNAALTTLEGLRYVSPRRGLIVRFNSALSSTGTLENVDVLTGSVAIEENSSMGNSVLPALQQVGGGISIINNDRLETLGLDALTAVTGDFEVVQNDALLELAGLPVLQQVGGTFSVIANARLESAAVPQLTRVGGLSIIGNPELETAADLPSLRFIENNLALVGNHSLRAVGNLPALDAVGTAVIISENPLLTGLTGLGRLLRLRALDVRNNASLVSLAGLSGLRELALLEVAENPELTRLDLDALVRVDVRFAVTDNPKLPACRATSLADAVYQGPVEERVIERNDDVAACGN